MTRALFSSGIHPRNFAHDERRALVNHRLNDRHDLALHPGDGLDQIGGIRTVADRLTQ